MPLPEDEFRRRLDMVTSEFANLLRNPEQVDSAPAELKLYGSSFVIGELWSAFVRERLVITITNTASGERLAGSNAASPDLPENTSWSGVSLFRRNPVEVTTIPAR